MSNNFVVTQDVSSGPVSSAADEPAGFWPRSMAFIIDLALLFGLSFNVFLGSAFFLVDSLAGFKFDRVVAISGGWFFLVAVVPFLSSLAYFSILHACGGRTVGKTLMGLKVVSVDDHPLEVDRSFLRWTGYLISAIFMMAGFFWIVLDRESRAWHDILALTKVVVDKRS